LSFFVVCAAVAEVLVDGVLVEELVLLPWLVVLD
jgi:hypothetical protein